MCTSWPFFATPGTSAVMGPLISAWITTVFPSVEISSITLTRKFGTAFGNARQHRCHHGSARRFRGRMGYIVQVRHLRKDRACHRRRGIVGSEELLGGRYVVFRVPFHLYAHLGSLLSGILCPSIQTTG